MVRKLGKWACPRTDESVLKCGFRVCAQESGGQKGPERMGQTRNAGNPREKKMRVGKRGGICHTTAGPNKSKFQRTKRALSKIRRLGNTASPENGTRGRDIGNRRFCRLIKLGGKRKWSTRDKERGGGRRGRTRQSRVDGEASNIKDGGGPR